MRTEAIQGVEFFRAGRRGDGRTYTAADLRAIVDAHERVRFKVPVKHECGDTDGACQVEMTEARRASEQPALGWVSRFYVRGDALMADLISVPRRLAEAIRAGKYQRVGVELYADYVHEATGSRFPLVLKSISFVGALPAITGLDDVAGLYEIDGTITGERRNTMYQPHESAQVDAEVKEYQKKHGEKDYSKALRAVLREGGEKARQEDEAEAKAHAEYGRRVRAYSEHFDLDSKEASRRVLADDPELKARVTKKEPLDPGSVIDVRARQYAKEHSVKYVDGVREVLADDPHLAECYRLNLPYLPESSKNYQAAEAGYGAKGRLGALLGGAKDDAGLLDVKLALKICGHVPDLCRRAADERLLEIAGRIAEGDTDAKFRSDALVGALRQARQDYPFLTATAESGRMSEASLREIFFAWFKD